jgi:hypothetical protein
MPDADKTVFISYRRSVSFYPARSIFMDLRYHDYDVFIDVESIDSGTFDTIILNQIAARAHFLVVLSPGALKRINEQGDWLRREIEHAMELKRNIVPVLASGFTFETEGTNLRGKLSQLKRYNAVDVPETYFDAAMAKLRDRFLKTPTSAPITPAPANEHSIVQSRIEEILRTKPDAPSWTLTPLEAKSWIQANGWIRTPAAPKLRVEPGILGVKMLKWTSVPRATGYVLQESTDSAFTFPVELYKGDKTEFFKVKKFDINNTFPTELYKGDKTEFFKVKKFDINNLLWMTTYYRVKATSEPFFSLDNPWSNVVEIGPHPFGLQGR